MNIPKSIIFLIITLAVLPQCAKQQQKILTKKNSHKNQMPLHQVNQEATAQATTHNAMPHASIEGTVSIKPEVSTINNAQPTAIDSQELTEGALPATSPVAKPLPHAHMPSANKQEDTAQDQNIKPESVITTPQQGLIPLQVTQKKQPTPAEELDFKVENITGKTIYIACFAYMRTRINSNWRWRKSPIYKLDNKQLVLVYLATVHDKADRGNVFGVLGIFDSLTEAENATYELTPDKNKLDLDQLIKLKGHKVVIETERYGFKKPFFEYDFVKVQEEIQAIKGSTPELDLLVVNNTKKPLYICGFAYMKKAKSTWIAAIDEKDDMSPWRYDKTPVLRVEHNQTAYIDIDTIVSSRDRENVLGFLGIFNENEEKLAHKSTYELLSPRHKLSLGNLKQLKNKKIILEIQQYGTQGDIIDYVVKPIKHIDWSKAVGKPR